MATNNLPLLPRLPSLVSDRMVLFLDRNKFYRLSSWLLEAYACSSKFLVLLPASFGQPDIGCTRWDLLRIFCVQCCTYCTYNSTRTVPVQQDPRFLLNSVYPGYHSTKPLYILFKITRRFRNSVEIGGSCSNVGSF